MISFNGKAIQGYETVSELVSGTFRDGTLAKVKGLQGGDFEYDSTQAGANDGGLVINGWVRQLVDNVVTPEMFGAQSTDKSTIPTVDVTTKLQTALLVSKHLKLASNRSYLLSDKLTLDNHTLDLNGSRLYSTSEDVIYFNDSAKVFNGVLHAEGVGVNFYPAVVTNNGINNIDHIMLIDVEITSPNGINNGIAVDATNTNIETVTLSNVFVHDVGRIAVEIIAHDTNGINFIKNAVVTNLITKDSGLISQFGMGLSFSGRIKNASVEGLHVENYKDIGLEFASVQNGYAKNITIIAPSVQEDYSVQASVSELSYNYDNESITINGLHVESGVFQVASSDTVISGVRLESPYRVFLDGKGVVSSMTTIYSGAMVILAGADYSLNKFNANYLDTNGDYLAIQTGAKVTMTSSEVSSPTTNVFDNQGNTVVSHTILSGSNISNPAGNLTCIDSTLVVPQITPISGAGELSVVRTTNNGEPLIVDKDASFYKKALSRRTTGVNQSVDFSVAFNDNSGWRSCSISLGITAVDIGSTATAHKFLTYVGRYYSAVGFTKTLLEPELGAGLTLTDVYDEPTNTITFTITQDTVPASGVDFHIDIEVGNESVII